MKPSITQVPRTATIRLRGWPFDLAATLGSGQVFHWHPWQDGFAGLIGEEPVFVAQPEPGRLVCSEGRENLVQHYLGLDHDMERIVSSFPQDDTTLHTAIRWCPGLRLIRQPAWECLATFITSSLKQVPHIRQIALRLRERFGRRITAPGLPTQYSYPTPEAMAAAGESALRACGLGYRAAFLERSAATVAAGDISLDEVAALPDSEAAAALCRLHGVGEKIAACALLFGWERHGAFPIDVWIERALRELYFTKKRKVTAKRIRHFAITHFGPARGYAQQFLFHWARITGCGQKS